MWKDFDFNEPYDGSFPEKINGADLPNEYIEFMRKHNGCYGDTGESYLVLFPIEELEESNDDYNISDYLEGCFIEEEYLTVIGDSIENLPEDINKFWKNLC